MVYVDLNPIRARIAKTLGDSTYTSIQQRISEYTNTISVGNKKDETNKAQDDANPELSWFIGDDPDAIGIPYHLADYFELTDWTGRAILENKTGFIPEQTPHILNKLGIETQGL